MTDTHNADLTLLSRFLRLQALTGEAVSVHLSAGGVQVTVLGVLREDPKVSHRRQLDLFGEVVLSFSTMNVEEVEGSRIHLKLL